MSAEENKQISILIPEASASGMIAVIRSLGRAGYSTHAVSSSEDALGLYSNFAVATAVHPPYGADEFVQWLRSYIHDNSIDLIVPSEGFYLAIQSYYDEFASKIAVGSGYDSVYQCLSKTSVFDLFLAAGGGAAQSIPPSLVVDNEGRNSVEQFAAAHAPPYYLKGDGTHHKRGANSVVTRADDKNRLIEIADDLLNDYDKILIQGSVDGVKATDNVCFHKGKLLADSMAIAEHENPHTGGLTSLRKSWWHEDIYKDALYRLELLHWDGPAMMEYKWDASNERFYFIEINSRYWAALHLDLFAGRDFPRLQIAHILGQTIPPQLGPLPPTTCCLHTPAEAGHVISIAKDRQIPIIRKFKTVVQFGVSLIDPRVHSDYFFPGDRALFFRSFGRFILGLFR